MARKTLHGTPGALYPGLQDRTDAEILRIVEERYPGLPPMTRRSVVADLLRTIILTQGGRGKRGTVQLAESILAPWISALEYGTNITPGHRVLSNPDKAQAQLRRDLFATYDAAMMSAIANPTDHPPGTEAPGEDRSETPQQTTQEVSQETWRTDPPPIPDPHPNPGGQTHTHCAQCGRARTPREVRYRPTQETCYHCATKGTQETTPEAQETPEDPSTGTEAPSVELPAGDPQRAYLHWSKSVRAMCERRNADGHPLDDWSMRPTLDGLRLIAAGCPVEAVMDAVTMHFPADARQECGVAEYDFTAFGVAEYLRRAASARVPLFLIGGKGTGKTTHCKRLAENLGTAFGMVSVTAGTSPSAFYGRPIIGSPTGEVVPSRFQTIYQGGGVYLFDEIDAADPNILLIVNAALADGGRWSNPQTGEECDAHPDFIPVAAGNTIGLGASRDYTGRDRLDAATLDRFCAGRVRVKLDDELETTLAERIIAGGGPR